MKTNFEYREIGKKKLRQNPKELILLFFIYSLIVSIPNVPYYNEYVDLGEGMGYTNQVHFLSWATIFLVGAMAYGLAIVVKKSYYGINTNANDLFLGFKDYGNNLVLGFLIQLYTTLWFLLLIVPGIIAAIKYSMAYYIRLDNPNLTPSQCIDESKKLMDGHKAEYFSLMLSYIGWVFLGVLTFGILLLWVIPWINYSKYDFYLDITGKKNVEETTTEEEAF